VNKIILVLSLVIVNVGCVAPGVYGPQPAFAPVPRIPQLERIATTECGTDNQVGLCIGGIADLGDPGDRICSFRGGGSLTTAGYGIIPTEVDVNNDGKSDGTYPCVDAMTASSAYHRALKRGQTVQLMVVSASEVDGFYAARRIDTYAGGSVHWVYAGNPVQTKFL